MDKEIVSAIAAGVVTAVLAWFHGHYMGNKKAAKNKPKTKLPKHGRNGL